MARYPGFIGGSYVSQSKIAADDELINLYPESIESGTGKNRYALYPAPGYELFYDLNTVAVLGTDRPIAGLYTMNGVTYAAAGQYLYRLPDVSQADGGTISFANVQQFSYSNPGDELVPFASNGDAGDRIVFTSGGQLYSVNFAADHFYLGFGPAGVALTGLAYSDTYLLGLDSRTSKVYLSAPNATESWDLLDVKQREDQPDKWVAIQVSFHREVWLIGLQTSTVLYHSGAEAFPFTLNPSAAVPYGTLAPRSACLLGGSPVWLAHDGTVRWFSDGYVGARISTHAVETAIAGYANTGEADAFSYSDNGHTFYVLSFPTAGVTWVYDTVTALWHKRGAWDGNDFTALPVRAYTRTTQGYHLVGSRADGKIYRMRTDVATDTDGTGLRRLRRAPHLCNEQKLIIYDSFELDCDTGVGLTTGQGSDPKLTLRWSNDGGQTWSQPREASLGASGAYGTRPIWRRLGSGRDRVFELSCSEPVPVRWIDAYLETRGAA